MITNEKIKDNIKPSDLEIVNKILSYKEKYSPEELKSIISQIEKPLLKFAFKLFLT